MTELHHTNYWTWNDKEYRFDVFLSDDFSHLENVKQVYTVVLNKEKTKTLLVHSVNAGWILPGGTVEEGETLLDTLTREIKEETNRSVDMSTVHPFFYQLAYKKNEAGEWGLPKTECRFEAIVDEDSEFVSDPDNDIDKVMWVSVSELEKYLDWKETTVMIQEELAKQNV